MMQQTYNDKPLLWLVALTMFSSSFVLVEPAPYEVFMLFTIIFSFYFNRHLYNHIHFWPSILLLIFITLNFISMFFVKQIGDSINFFMITIYLVLSWAGLIGICMHYQEKLLPYIFKGYALGAVLSVLVGFIAFQSGFFADIFLQFGRIKGFFKDPNVFGPYLIPSSLYVLWMVTQKSLQKIQGWIYLCMFLILSCGILLSFSRAAWGQYLLAILYYFIFIRLGSLGRMKMITLLMLVGIPLLIYIIIATESYHLFLNRLGLQHYDETRFSNQENALNYIIQHPLGMGPGQAENQLTISTHSLYIRILYENGFLSLITFLGFYLISLCRSIYLQFNSNNASQGYFVIISACLIGLLFNSFFIDTIHWRHMWLLLALPYMNNRKDNQN